MPINGKNRSSDSMTFNVVDQIELTATALNVSASQVLATVLDSIPVTLPTKVLRVGVTAQAVSGTTIGLQIVCGTVAPTEANTVQDAIATKGMTVFAATVPIHAANAFAMITIAPEEMNTIYPEGQPLTLRVQSDAHATATGLRVFADVSRYDGNPSQPLLHQLGPTDF